MGWALGQTPLRAFLHGVWVFMGAWSTGGFAPQSYNTMWFHSLAYELVTVAIFVAGSFNFALHWAVWSGNRKELRRNLETVSFAVTLSLTVLVATVALSRLGIYPDAVNLFRKAFYQLASGHTTTGFSTIYSRAFVVQWGPLAMLATTVAMAIGASACSTAGGIKGMRVGVITAGFVADIRRMISPESALIRQRVHHLRDILVDSPLLRSALTVTVAYLTLYGLVAIVGAACGYDFLQAAFEGVSAASNTGLSCGVTAPAMPVVLKVVYTLAMWLGRLEFMSVLALAGYAYAMVRGR